MKQKSIKSIRQEFRKDGVFYTPPELAEKLKEYVDIKPKNVYDPTCGAGNLLRVFDDEVDKYGQEIDAEQLHGIDIPNFHGAVGDTLLHDAFSEMKFDCIVANPPFSVKWEPEKLAEDLRFSIAPAMAPPSKADWAFMLHILYHLADDGVAVVLEFPGILYRGQREGKIRQWFIENNYIDKIVNVPGNTFEDTAIATCLIVLRKNRTTTDIVIENDGVSRAVSLDEIAQNSYVLSPSTYVYKEPERIELNPDEIKADARKSFLRTLRATLDMERLTCKLDGGSIQPFIDDIRQVLTEYDTEGEV